MTLLASPRNAMSVTLSHGSGARPVKWPTIAVSHIKFKIGKATGLIYLITYVTADFLFLILI